MDKVAVIEWDGVEYEFEYSFQLIRRLRGEGLNVAKIYREISKDPDAAADYMDDIACVLTHVLHSAGCKSVTEETFFQRALGDPEFTQTVFQLFIWIAVSHLTQSPKVPTPSKKKPKAKATKKVKKGKS